MPIGLRNVAEALAAVLLVALLIASAIGLLRSWEYAEHGFLTVVLDAVVERTPKAILAGALLIGTHTVLLCIGSAMGWSWVARARLAAAGAAVLFVTATGWKLAMPSLPALLSNPSALLLPLVGLVGAAVLAAAGLEIWTRWRLAAPRRHTALLVAAPLAVLLSLHATTWSLPRFRHQPNVIILVVDALRADHLGCYGYDRNTSPNIDALARDSVLFRQAISQSTFTKASIASLFTGLYPFRHGVYWGNHKDPLYGLSADVLSPDHVTLAELLLEHGWLTAAWVRNPHLRADMGFAQGFVRYHDRGGSIGSINRRFLRWLDETAVPHPFFAYLHYLDLHDPYRPKPPYDTMFGVYSDVYAGVDFKKWGAYLDELRRGERQLDEADVAQLIAYYDGQLRYMDAKIGELLTALRDAGVYDQSLIILTADHGDGFMEHGFISHSTSPYEELIRVPLLVKFPGSRDAGKKIDKQVELIDLMPTVAEFLSVEAAAPVQGSSLLRYVRGNGPVEKNPEELFSVSEIAEKGTEPTIAVRTERYKYIDFGDRPDEFYDLTADPTEQRNVLSVAEEEAAAFRAYAERIRSQRNTSAERLQLDESTAAELRALGYLE